jgi:hypothetical protein
MKPFVSKPLELPAEREAITRADLVFYDVDHSGPSYRAHVFLDNSKANSETELEPENGYVGSFTIFGHAGCFGEEGHCHPMWPTTDEFDRRPQHPLVPFTRELEITPALKQFTKVRASVTVVPEVSEVKGVTAPDVAPASLVRLAVYED